MARRRLPSITPSVGELQKPASSGPRWSKLSRMRSEAAWSKGQPFRTQPTMPHMYRSSSFIQEQTSSLRTEQKHLHTKSPVERPIQVAHANAREDSGHAGNSAGTVGGLKVAVLALDQILAGVVIKVLFVRTVSHFCGQKQKVVVDVVGCCGIRDRAPAVRRELDGAHFDLRDITVAIETDDNKHAFMFKLGVPNS